MEPINYFTAKTMLTHLANTKKESDLMADKPCLYCGTDSRHQIFWTSILHSILYLEIHKNDDLEC